MARIHCRICWKLLKGKSDLNSYGEPALTIGREDGKPSDPVCFRCGVDRAYTTYRATRAAIDRADAKRAKARKRGEA